ncbi:ArnT family glycosyltransferase [Alienimonas californiensis]|uniref:Glycosyltransferase RgtA/B/C/D-like domain-containing protein n=1 Tax=Alienimonas californiensis TaxID=2527989 RepID=A0A517P9C6_9PLAN|nr:hypothetical protein [Alienimonas californiensis]QDT15971.1 hypothetical protein CA12_20690 [Alienimonas californiensis]
MPSFPRPAAVRCPPGWAVVASVVTLAAGLRAAAVGRWAGEVAVDVDMYRSLAANLLDGAGYVSPETGTATAFRPPLVPLIYAALGNLHWAILLFQILAGAATAGLTVQLARVLGLNWLGAMLAGAVVACDPILLRYTPRPMTEVTAALLTVALLCRACRVADGSRDRQGARWRGSEDHVIALPDGRGSRGGAALTGVLFGLSALCRPTVWAFGGLWALGWIWDRLRGRAGWRLGWGRLALGAVGVALIVGPWAARNWIVFERPILMTTHGGYTLHLANNEVFYEEIVRGPAGAVWGGGSLSTWQQRTEGAFAVESGVDVRTVRNARFWFPPSVGWRGPSQDIPITQLRAESWSRTSLLQLGPQGWQRAPRPEADWARLTWVDTTGLGLSRDVQVESGPQWFFSPEAEPRRDRWHRDRALEVIQSDPAGFARAVPLRVSRLWSPTPQGPAAEGLPAPVWGAVGGWNVVVFLLAAAGAVRVWRSDRWAAWRPVLLMVVSVTAVHAVYWSNARMRGPIVPAIAVLAAAGACGKRLRGEGETTETEPAPGVGSFGREGNS